MRKPFFYDPIAGATVKLVACSHKGSLNDTAAAGCLAEGKGKLYLVTNYHVLTGIRPEQRFNNQNPAFENEIEVWHGGVPIGRFNPARADYLVHPGMRELLCDLVAVPIEQIGPSPQAKKGLGSNYLFEGRADGFHLVEPLNRLRQQRPISNAIPHRCVEDMFLPVGRDTIVFGFPGANEFNFNPIGVNSKIASTAYSDNPQMLLSGPVYKGCSGAPVVARSIGGYQAFREAERPTLGGGVSLEYGIVIEIGSVALTDQLLGIYSGRIKAKDNDINVAADGGLGIGQVWKWQLVLQLVEDGIPDYQI